LPTKTFPMRLISRCLTLFLVFTAQLVQAGGHISNLGHTGDPAIIHAGTLLDHPGKAPRGPATIAVKDGRVAAVADGYQESSYFSEVFSAKATVRIIDLRNSFVLPGLMDAHVHITAQPSLFVNNARNGGGKISKSDFALNANVHAQRTLAAGFTAVRDVGSDDESVFALRDAINQGLVPGPTIVAAGPTLSATGGHGDRGNGASSSLHADERRELGVCDGADECRQAVRHNIRLGSDLIKFTATGGFMSATGTQQQYEAEEMRAIVETAHQRKLKVAAHVYSAAAARVALGAGVDSLEHGWLLDDAALRMMKKQGAYLVPTLLISRPSAWADMAGTGGASELRDKNRSFEKAYAMGANIAFGTDVGIFDHGQNALEFSVMTELGMSAGDAIHSATVVTANLLGVDAGVIEAGKRADIIAVSGNPLEDISRLQQVDFVMKSGTVYKQDGVYTGGVSTRPVRSPVSFK